jgi:hypothetical protein
MAFALLPEKAPTPILKILDNRVPVGRRVFRMGTASSAPVSFRSLFRLATPGNRAEHQFC